MLIIMLLSFISLIYLIVSLFFEMICDILCLKFYVLEEKVFCFVLFYEKSEYSFSD